MNYIWCFMIIVSIVVSIFNGTVDQTINGAFYGIVICGSYVLLDGYYENCRKCGIVTEIREIIKTYNKLPVSQCRSKRKKIYCREYECQHTRNGQRRYAYGHKGYAMS